MSHTAVVGRTGGGGGAARPVPAEADFEMSEFPPFSRNFAGVLLGARGLLHAVLYGAARPGVRCRPQRRGREPESSWRDWDPGFAERFRKNDCDYRGQELFRQRGMTQFPGRASGVVETEGDVTPHARRAD